MTSGTIHALTADLFVIEGKWPSPSAAVYRCGERLCLLDSGAGKAQRAAIRAVAVSYNMVDELVLLSSGPAPHPEGNDDLLEELPARRRRHVRPGGASTTSQPSSSVTVEDYADWGGSGSVLVGSQLWPGWSFPDSDLDVLSIGPLGGQIGFHAGRFRALILPGLLASPFRIGYQQGGVPLEPLLALLEDEVEVVSVGFGPPLATAECRHVLSSMIAAWGATD